MTRWIIWSAIVIAWTVALEYPVPDPEPHSTAGEFVIAYKYLLGKSLHVGVYATLAVLSAWVPVPTRFRWVMMFVLMFHAWGTEMLQYALEPWCQRTGTLSDIGFDIVGIVLGTAASWKWWTRE